ncbi:oligosaccharide flippase family protein [Bacteroides sp.]|uniref:oligosaccharide flippase family protein n=1 Tax=Bacteroides sp. TaxID=29523 RepID=UPI00261856C9|nr:oligosaccharide flippase family protein [Bacteroides sp.]MDD3038177.1 oligosaccharide flippase family protein [Bacteroides sp.]
MADNTYKGIFKSTALFGFVQLFKAIISIIKSKAVALLLGPAGMGVMGIYNSTLQLIQTGAGLGISQSAVRDIAESNGSNNKILVSKIISITTNIILIIALIGAIITLLFSSKLSDWTMGDSNYTISYAILSIAVFFNILNEGNLAILKGLRKLRYLAFASMIGTGAGLLTAIPLYYFFGEKGIVPELIIAGSIALIATKFFIKKSSIGKYNNISIKEVFIGAMPMIKLGSALMFTSVLQTAIALVINSYIKRTGGLEDVGCYSAAMAIINNYFALIINALSTDYYPRIAAVNKDNSLLQDELNKQSSVSVVLCCPMFVFLVSFVEFFIIILYSKEFIPAIDYLRYGIYWTLIIVCSNQVDMILVAKGKSKVFLFISIVFRIIQLVLCLFLYTLYGLTGLGVGYACLGVIHMVIMCITVYVLYKIKFSRQFIKLFSTVLGFAVVSTLISYIPDIITRTLLGLVIFSISMFFSYRVCKNCFEIDLLAIVINKLKK